MGVVHKADPDWATFIPPLLKAMELTNGKVLELGMGIFSTPLLHILCAAQDRHLESYDNDGRFFDMFSRFNSEGHFIGLVPSWDWDKLDGAKCSVALVDSKPAESRKELIKQLTEAEYVIVHDTQERADEFYGFEEIYPLFKYRYDYTKFANQTTVLSNQHNVNIFHNTFN